MSSPSLTFHFRRLRFHLRALDPLTFPAPLPANLLRGALGLELRRQYCAPSCESARACPQAATCAYARLFEPHRSGGGPSGLADPPRPFVFRAAHLAGCTIQADEPFWFDLHLFALDPGLIGSLAKAFAHVASDGIGPGRSRAMLGRVAALDLEGREFAAIEPGDSPPPLSLDLSRHADALAAVEVRFITPIELKADACIASRPDFGVLFARLLERISTLRACSGEGPLNVDHAAWLARAAQVRLRDYEWRRVEARRRSSRTGQTHPLGGRVGWARYEGEMGPFGPFLQLGQFTGVGRQTVWGKGEIRVARSGAAWSSPQQVSR